MLAHLGQLDGLDHLADGGVGANQNGMTIFLRQIEGQVGQIGVLLNARRGKNNGAVVAVAAAAGQLPVVALTLEDVAQAGADTHDVRDDRRDVVTAEVRDAFLLQGEAKPAEVVSARAPQQAAPKSMLMPASSDSVWMN